MPVKKVLSIGASVLVVGGMLSFVVAGASERAPAAAAEAAPSYEILAAVREMGFAPSTQVHQRGAYYVLHAVDPRGVEVRVVADAHSGTILSVIPLRRFRAQAPRYYGGPRIIQVPQAEESDQSTAVYDRRDVVAPHGDEDVRAAPPPVISAPPPPARRRTVLNPPRERDKALSPIYPTPRFDTGAEASKKFEPQGDGAVGAPPPLPAD